MRKTSLAIASITLVLFLGCKNQSTNNAGTSANPYGGGTAVATSNLTPEELGELGAKIKKHPKEAERLLSDRGLTELSFEQAVRKVAESPEQSKRYASAYKKAS